MLSKTEEIHPFGHTPVGSLRISPSSPSSFMAVQKCVSQVAHLSTKSNFINTTGLGVGLISDNNDSISVSSLSSYCSLEDCMVDISDGEEDKSEIRTSTKNSSTVFLEEANHNLKTRNKLITCTNPQPKFTFEINKNKDKGGNELFFAETDTGALRDNEKSLKSDCSRHSLYQQQSTKRQGGVNRTRNCQESVSGAFAELRKRVPTYPIDRKLNKSDILRLTIRYIRLLTSVREWQENNNSDNNNLANCEMSVSSDNIGITILEQNHQITCGHDNLNVLENITKNSTDITSSFPKMCTNRKRDRFKLKRLRKGKRIIANGMDKDTLG